MIEPVLLTEYRLTPVAEGERASFVEMSFEVCLVWRSNGGAVGG